MSLNNPPPENRTNKESVHKVNALFDRFINLRNNIEFVKAEGYPIEKELRNRGLIYDLLNDKNIIILKPKTSIDEPDKFASIGINNNQLIIEYDIKTIPVDSIQKSERSYKAITQYLLTLIPLFPNIKNTVLKKVIQSKVYKLFRNTSNVLVGNRYYFGELYDIYKSEINNFISNDDFDQRFIVESELNNLSRILDQAEYTFNSYMN
ncbi:MAG: hypothetical protein WCJ19_02985 [bacterium]